MTLIKYIVDSLNKLWEPVYAEVYNMKNVIVIGAGPAGMAAAISAAGGGASVTLIEKNEKIGKKLYITGKGRCNLTNDCDEEEFLKNVTSNSNFLYSAIYGYNSRYVMDFFESLGTPLKVERGGRVFPVSDKSSDIIKALKKELERLGCTVKLNTKVSNVCIQGDKVIGVYADGDFLKADAVIIATGGLSYQSTGSSGDGYKFAESAGHEIVALSPALVPLKSPEQFIKELAGLSLKNVSVRLLVRDKQVFQGFGEMLFTHTGVSGPLILTASRYYESGDAEIAIDLKPALDADTLDKRVLKDFAENKNKQFKNSLDALLPAKIIPIVIKKSAIDMEKKVNEITRAERENLIAAIKAFSVKVGGTEGFNQAVITVGGISVKGVNPKTMESKHCGGLYFAGEVLDLDALTGGYNLQIAFCTGFLAGAAVTV